MESRNLFLKVLLELCGARIRSGKRTDKFNGFPRPNNQFTLHASERATQGKYEKDHSAPGLALSPSPRYNARLRDAIAAAVFISYSLAS